MAAEQSRAKRLMVMEPQLLKKDLKLKHTFIKKKTKGKLVCKIVDAIY